MARYRVDPFPTQQDFMQSDEQLIEAVQAGDAAAFESLVLRHGDRFFNFMLRLTGNRQDAEDMVQEAFIRLWRNPFAWKPQGGRFTTWFHRVLINLFLDHKRRVKKTENDDVLADIPDDGKDQEHALIDEQQDRLLVHAVGSLPPQQHAAIQLFYYDGFSQAEAASVLRMHVKAFESLLHRARHNLRKELKVRELKNGGLRKKPF